MKKFKKVFIIALVIAFLINAVGCTGKPKTKTIKEEVLVDAVRKEMQVTGQKLVGQRVVGQRIIGYDEVDFSSPGGRIEEEKSDSSEIDDSSDENDYSNKPLTDNLIEDGKLNYRIIRGNDCASEVTTAVADCRKAISTKLNCTVEYKTDSVKASDNIRELIIGGTNRAATAEAEKKLRANRKYCYYDAIVCTVGKDVAIFAYDTNALNKALDYFIENYLRTDLKKVSKNINWIFEGDKKLASLMIDGKDISNFRIVIPKNPSQILLGASDMIQSSVEQVSGFPIDIVFDDAAASKNEIIIGNTNNNITAPKDETSYKFEISSGKLYISSASEEALYYGIRKFTAEIKQSDTVKLSSVSKTVAATDYTKGWLDYELTWSDEFNATELNDKYWNLTISTAASYNGGQVKYRPDNVWVEDGIVKIKSEQTNVKNFSAGEINTNNKVMMKYGYLETRMRLPAGNTYSAWWLNSTKQANDVIRPEIDMLETFSSPKTILSNLHTWAEKSDGQVFHINHYADCDDREYAAPGDSLLADEWHILAVEWTPETITFLADGIPYCIWDITGKDYEAFNKDDAPPVANIMGHWMGHEGPANVDNSIMEIDWVRLYQKNDGRSYVTVK